jgi:nucleotidyltransferase substrate binding protein (TIGR01987 family)
MTPDIRWQQRFAHFQSALEQLKAAVALGDYSELEKQGLIQCFEYTYELGWNTLKDFLEDQGHSIRGPKDAIQAAFRIGLISDGESWMRMFKSRNLTSHTYNRQIADEVVEAIRRQYFPLMAALVNCLETEK